MEWQDPSKAQASRAHMTRSRPMGGSVAPQGSPPLPHSLRLAVPLWESLLHLYSHALKAKCQHGLLDPRAPLGFK